MEIASFELALEDALVPAPAFAGLLREAWGDVVRYTIPGAAGGAVEQSAGSLEQGGTRSVTPQITPFWPWAENRSRMAASTGRRAGRRTA